MASMDEPEAVRFDLRPYHAMRALIGLWVVLAMFTWPGIGCWLAAGLYVWAEWYTRTRRTCWPADIEGYLARRGWAFPRNVPAVVTHHPPIPFRPMAIPELYYGAVKIVRRNWPTLIGVPAVIYTGFIVALAAIVWGAGQILDSPEIADLLRGGDGDLWPGAAVLLLAMFVTFGAVVLPGDGLLISLGAHAADKAVRGERIRFDETFHQAKKSKLAVCRLIGTYYLLGAAGVAVQIVAFFSGWYVALIPIMVMCGVAWVVLGIVLSMAPVVLVLEQRGIAASFRRSIELCKPAVGRILVINLVWIAAVAPVVMLSKVTLVVVVIASPVICGVVRCVQMLTYADLRMRQDDYGHELRTDWARNMGCDGLASG